MGRYPFRLGSRYSTIVMPFVLLYLEEILGRGYALHIGHMAYFRRAYHKACIVFLLGWVDVRTFRAWPGPSRRDPIAPGGRGLLSGSVLPLAPRNRARRCNLPGKFRLQQKILEVGCSA